MKPKFFRTQSDFRKWLEKNHDRDKELLVGFRKVGSGLPSMTWPQSVDEALCFGWIDGVRRSIDAENYCIRFTPRKSGSIWSRVNIAKVEALKKSGLMHSAGLEAYERRDDKRSGVYSFEQSKPVTLDARLLREFKRDAEAWERFSRMAPSYRKAAIHWVMSARQEATRQRRFLLLVTESAADQKVPPLRWGKGKPKA